jgi:4-amino-4-deoxy-L-arabinose transferase-like glycosyltransferase
MLRLLGPGVLLCTIAALELFWGLGSSRLRDWDEAIFAQAAKGILETGDWVTLQFRYAPWFEKPPLFVWSIASLYHVFGVTEFWSRAASAISGVLLVLLTFMLGSRLYGRLTGAFACVVLLSSEAFVRSARLAMSDTMLALFIYAAVYGYVRVAEGKATWWWMVWVALAGGIMTKWVAVFPAFVGIGGAVLLGHSGREALRARPFWFGLAAALLIALPWHVLMYGRYGQAFLHTYVGFNIVVRATTTLNPINGPRFYLEQLGTQFVPWVYLLPFAVARVLRDAVRQDWRARLLLLVVGPAFAICSIMPTKLPWYMVPLLPGFALSIAVILTAAWESASSYEWSAAAFVAGLLWVTSSLPARTKVVGLVVAGIVLSLPLLIGSGSHWRRVATTALLGSFVLLGMAQVQRLFRVDERPVAALARLARTPAGEARDTLFLGPGLSWPSALFYSDRPVAARSLDELARLAQHRQRDVILSDSDLETLARRCEIEPLAESRGYTYVRVRAGSE